MSLNNFHSGFRYRLFQPPFETLKTIKMSYGRGGGYGGGNGYNDFGGKILLIF